MLMWIVLEPVGLESKQEKDLLMLEEKKEYEIMSKLFCFTETYVQP